MPLPHYARKTVEPEWVPLGADGRMLPKAKVKKAGPPCPRLMDPGIPGVQG